MTTYVIGPRGFPLWEKDPQAVKDYQFDWTAWLAGDTVGSHTVTVETGLTKDSDSRVGGVVTVWLSGGTKGRTYKVTCHVVTTGGRTDERTIEIVLKDQ
jgi:hypothetical protein